MRDVGIECIDFMTGANTYERPRGRDPNEVNQHSEVKVYRLNPDGTQGEFLRTEPAYPEGWDDPAKRKQIPIYKDLKGENDMARCNWEELWPQVQELQAQGKNVKEIAAELEIDLNSLRMKIYREEKAVEKQTPRRKAATINPDFEAAFEKQTPTPAPEELGGTDPERESQESAKNIIPEPVNMPIGCELPRGDGFTAADEEPIPYSVAEELSPLASVGNQILVEAWEKIDAVIKDPVALPLLKELIRQGVA